jgi:hypothetical protein
LLKCIHDSLPARANIICHRARAKFRSSCSNADAMRSISRFVRS